MIHSFLTGGLFRFSLRFVPSVFEKTIDVISEHLMQKRSIEYDKMKLEQTRINSSTQLDLADIKYAIEELKIEYDKMKLEQTRINSSTQLDLADIKYAIEELKVDQPIRLARIKAQKVKSGVKWIDGLDTLIRPLTTFFWIIVYPLLVWWSVKEGIFDKSPLSVLTPFEQKIIACILGFWYTDKIVQKKRELE